MPIKTILALLGALELAGCASLGLTSPTPSQDVAATIKLVQADYPLVVSVAADYVSANPSDTATSAAIQKAESVAGPLVSALSTSSTAANVEALKGAVLAIVNGPAGGKLSTSTKLEISLAVTAVAAYVESQVPPQAAPAAPATN
jgi:hypothetical protein